MVFLRPRREAVQFRKDVAQEGHNLLPPLPAAFCTFRLLALTFCAA
jgi:hypothetical protein